MLSYNKMPSWAHAAGLPLCLLSAEMHNRTIAFMVHGTDRQPRTVEAALAPAEGLASQQQAERHACC